MTEQLKERISKKRLAAFTAGLLSLALIAGTMAFYTSTHTINNPLTVAGVAGDELVEEFKIDTDWKAGEAINKKVRVDNKGEVPLLVRIKMEENWTFSNASTLQIKSSDSTKFNPASATTGLQLSPTDGLTAGDGSNVYKVLAASGWTLHTDGYWYYNNTLGADASTNNLLESLTLVNDVDMGLKGITNYYTEKATEPTTYGSNPANDWVAYVGAQPPSTAATFKKSVSAVDANAAGYSNAGYVLTITSETIESTAASHTAAGWPTAATIGAGVTWTFS